LRKNGLGYILIQFKKTNLVALAALEAGGNLKRYLRRFFRRSQGTSTYIYSNLVRFKNKQKLCFTMKNDLSYLHRLYVVVKSKVEGLSPN
jgi:hypothetical protein